MIFNFFLVFFRFLIFLKKIKWKTYLWRTNFNISAASYPWRIPLWCATDIMRGARNRVRHRYNAYPWRTWACATDKNYLWLDMRGAY
jgi:hypothetical protein